MIRAERQRQVKREGWTAEHDEQHEDEGLLAAAICYALNKSDNHAGRIITGRKYHDGYFSGHTAIRSAPPMWPWDEKWDKRKKHDRIRSLSIAGALLAAEIDRLQKDGG